MSTYYYVYLEAEIDNEWKLICPKIQTKNKDSISPIIYGSRSWFSAMNEKLLDLGGRINFCNLSPELKNVINTELIDSEPLDLEDKPSWFYAVQCNINSFFNAIPNDCCKEYHGYVDKNSIMAYKLDGEEIYSWLDIEEYRDLSEKEKLMFEYFEWNSFDSWLSKFLQMKPIINWVIDSYCDANEIYDKDNIKFRLISIML